ARRHCAGQAITVSIGATTLRPGETAPDWLQRADAAMYRAKNDGRNRVVVDAPVALARAPDREPAVR
ncbi:MAG: diguanylate cyclase, partial [Pseudomonadota bacterium]|nr:diguanylate cyclase [Pseudomonadota bacterium]